MALPNAFKLMKEKDPNASSSNPGLLKVSTAANVVTGTATDEAITPAVLTASGGLSITGEGVTTFAQSGSAGSDAVISLDQQAPTLPIIDFEGTVATGASIEAVGAKTLTTTHFIKISIDGVGNRYIPAGTIA
jgi:hypothetical protein